MGDRRLPGALAGPMMIPDRWVDGHPDETTLAQWLAWYHTAYRRGKPQMAEESMVFHHLGQGCVPCFRLAAEIMFRVFDEAAQLGRFE